MSSSGPSSCLHQVQEFFRDVKSHVFISKKYSALIVALCASALVNSNFVYVKALVNAVSILLLILTNPVLRERLIFLKDLRIDAQ